MPKFSTCDSKEEKDAMIHFIKTRQYPPGISEMQKRDYRRKAKKFAVLNDELHYKGKESLLPVVFAYEVELAREIIAKEHKMAHLGVTKTAGIIRRKYYGIPIRMIIDYIRNCEPCMKCNVDPNAAKRTLSVGDSVLVKRDFSTKRKREPFETFYEDSTFTVTKVLTNNMVELRDSEGGVRVVPKAVTKKSYCS